MDPITSKNINQVAYPSLNEELKSLGKAIQFDSRLDIKSKILCLARNYDVACIFNNNYPTPHHESKYLAAFGEKYSVKIGKEKGAFEALKEFCDKYKSEWKFGYLTYDLKNDIEKLSSKNADELSFAAMHFFVPEEIIVVDQSTFSHQGLRDTQALFDEVLNLSEIEGGNALDEEEINALQSFPTKENYLNTINGLKEEINKGNIYEINFCRNETGSIRIDPYVTNQELNKQSPAPFSTFYKANDNFLICSSPERFIEKNDQKIRVQPIKGTKRRIKDSASDETLRKQLFEDKKERAENVMIVDLMRNDVSRSAESGSVKVEELYGIYSFPHVHHMISSVTAEIRKDVHFVDAIKDCFPMGSMTGAPKVRAMELIEEHEVFKRGLFSGSIGCISPSENFDFNVVIRSILYNETKGIVSIPTGSAITALCDGQKEWEECKLKAEALVSCLRKT